MRTLYTRPSRTARSFVLRNDLATANPAYWSLWRPATVPHASGLGHRRQCRTASAGRHEGRPAVLVALRAGADGSGRSLRRAGAHPNGRPTWYRFGSLASRLVWLNTPSTGRPAADRVADAKRRCAGLWLRQATRYTFSWLTARVWPYPPSLPDRAEMQRTPAIDR
jgi:hypothetical protein